MIVTSLSALAWLTLALWASLVVIGEYLRVNDPSSGAKRFYLLRLKKTGPLWAIIAFGLGSLLLGVVNSLELLTTNSSRLSGLSRINTGAALLGWLLLLIVAMMSAPKKSGSS